MKNLAIEFADFHYTPPGRERSVLRDVSLAVEAGEFVLVCGSSGSGKSTLLKAIAGIVPHHFGGHAAGEAVIAGCDLRNHNAASLAAVCGTVLQDPESQAVMGGVEAEIAFPLENAGLAAGAVALRVEQTAQALGIGGLLDRRTAELSGGELQRVVLAASLALSPELVVLDEPTSQLDPVAGDELLGLLLRLNRDHGRTVVVADHRIERLLEHADRVLVLDDGAVVFNGGPQDLLEWAAVAGRTDLMPQVARAFAAATVAPLPVGLRAARRVLAERGWRLAGAEALVDEGDGKSEDAGADTNATATGAPIPPEGGTPVLSARRLSFSYEEARDDALRDVTLCAAPGERIALMGANGSGKSTLLRILKGLDQPAGGSVTRRGTVELLLQNPNDYLLHERVADEAPVEALRRFGLERFAECDPRDLSGGERQRLALAIVMQSSPGLLLLDEPSRGMDRRRREQLVGELRAIAAAGTAVVLATHDAELAAEFAERVVLLGQGRVLADGRPAELLGGTFLSTDVARLLPGSGALTVGDAARLLAGDAGAIGPHPPHPRPVARDAVLSEEIAK